MKTSELQEFLYNLIISGFTISHSTMNGERFRVFNPILKKKYEIVLQFGENNTPHIGEVDNFSTNGRWLQMPKPIKEYASVLN